MWIDLYIRALRWKHVWETQFMWLEYIFNGNFGSVPGELYRFWPVLGARNYVNLHLLYKVAGVYSDPFFRPFVRSFVRLSPSLIRYSSKNAEQNFMKLSGIVHYIMTYCTSFFKFLSAWFWGFLEQNKDFAITTYRGTHL